MSSSSKSTAKNRKAAARAELLLYAELQRIEQSALDYLRTVEARASQLMASAAIVAALSAVVKVTVYTTIAMVLFVGAAALGAAAQWPRPASGGGAQRTLNGVRADGGELGIRSMNNGLAKAIEDVRSITAARSTLVRIGVVVQILALTVLVAGYAITFQDRL
ncbi:hypothetical protein [Demequina sp.]|uniref:hypothetical protein n=1 Tax=Demequina sp. TaxID=2050685 RepID=UPI003D0FD444